MVKYGLTLLGAVILLLGIYGKKAVNIKEAFYV
jgi:hypothetical protein